jgi:adenylosuccinate synthase
MRADVIVGGQAGSEGKGAIAARLLRTENYDASVRPGGSNAGHTVYCPEKRVHQVLPVAASVTEGVDCYLAPESYFGISELREEVKWAENSRVHVDPKAAIISGNHRQTERQKKLGEDIGSTVHGVGAATVEKIWRSSGDVKLAEDVLDDEVLSDRRVPVELSETRRTLVEGTQGTLLSMNQSPHWPFCTSRDCIASSFLSSCGIAPRLVGDVWAVFRTYPIRVGGHSGPMDGKEITFEKIAERAGHQEAPVEYTSVTGKQRRIFEWSFEQFDYAMRLNRPDHVALTFLDYIDVRNKGAVRFGQLTDETKRWIRKVQDRAREKWQSSVSLLKTGPKPDHIIDLR